MPSIRVSLFLFASVSLANFPAEAEPLAERFAPISYNNPGLNVDLGAGLWGWPVPCDRNGDGISDLVLIAGASPQKGAYYYENTGRRDPKSGAELFKPGVLLSEGGNDITPSWTGSTLHVLGPGTEYPDFLTSGLKGKKPLPVDPSSIHTTNGRVRGNQWSYVDFDGDGLDDLVVGIGDWTDYGWDNAYDENGRWTNGPLHGYVYLLRNLGTQEKPEYEKPRRLQADGRDIDVFGTPSPVFADFRGTGKLDLICGEFVDGLTFFENIGTREKPVYAPGRRLRSAGQPITMPLEMIVVTGYDWNQDGRPDLVASQEDGRVAWLENTGKLTDITDNTGKVISQIPEFREPQFFRQEADTMKFGVLSTPVSIDWDSDGKTDILTGNAAGEIAFIKNLGGTPPKWSEPELLETEGKPIRIMAGYNGSIQGPAESKWGYTNIGVGDWDGDGLPDILANSIYGKIIWFQNIGTKTSPRLAAGRPVNIAWENRPPKPAWNWWDPNSNELVVEWRCTPFVIDIDRDGINDLVSVDHEGYLSFFRQVKKNGERVLLPGKRIFRMQGPSSFDMKHTAGPEAEKDGPLRLNDAQAGRSGRRTYTFVDWDGDGKLDILVNSKNINFLRNVGSRDDEWTFKDEGLVDGKKLAGHSTSPGIVDWNADGVPDLLVGAEDGRFYFLLNPRTHGASDGSR